MVNENTKWRKRTNRWTQSVLWKHRLRAIIHSGDFYYLHSIPNSFTCSAAGYNGQTKRLWVISTSVSLCALFLLVFQWIAIIQIRLSLSFSVCITVAVHILLWRTVATSPSWTIGFAIIGAFGLFSAGVYDPWWQCFCHALCTGLHLATLSLVFFHFWGAGRFTRECSSATEEKEKTDKRAVSKPFRWKMNEVNDTVCMQKSYDPSLGAFESTCEKRDTLRNHRFLWDSCVMKWNYQNSVE